VETFEQWLNHYYSEYEIQNDVSGDTIEVLRDFWDHQQKKIDLINKNLEATDYHLRSVIGDSDKLRECLEFIDNTAPPMHKYTEIEMRMVIKARKCLKEMGE